ncbi:MAG: MBL fold metallo-hydrolase [Steroidobacteraceae bacterium]
MPALLRHPHGITAIDTLYVRPNLDAAHVLVHEDHAAIIDTGTSHSVPELVKALRELEVLPENVDYVLLTHIHLDHAGGAGALLRYLPNARVVVHPHGAAHMNEPGKLIAATIAVYGEKAYRSLYGEIVPIPAARILQTQDGMTLSLQSRELTFLHTPGHALHHYCIWDPTSRCVFSGDTFGLSYREFDTARGALILPATTPTQFDPAQLENSIDRLLALQPECIYLTHYSRVTDIPRLGRDLKAQIRQFVRIARSHAADAAPYDGIRADLRGLWLRLMVEHGCDMNEARFDALLELDLDLNAQGLDYWLKRESAQKVPLLAG